MAANHRHHASSSHRSALDTLRRLGIPIEPGGLSPAASQLTKSERSALQALYSASQDALPELPSLASIVAADPSVRNQDHLRRTIGLALTKLDPLFAAKDKWAIRTVRAGRSSLYELSGPPWDRFRGLGRLGGGTHMDNLFDQLGAIDEIYDTIACPTKWIENCISTTSPGSLTVISGEAGCGKTTLAALLATHLQQTSGPVPVWFYSSSDVRTSDLDFLCHHLCLAVAPALATSLYGEPTINRPRIIFEQWAQSCSREHPGSIVVDALDESGQQGVSLLDLLPVELPDTLRIFATVRTGETANRIVRRFGPRAISQPWTPGPLVEAGLFQKLCDRAGIADTCDSVTVQRQAQQVGWNPLLLYLGFIAVRENPGAIGNSDSSLDAYYRSVIASIAGNDPNSAALHALHLLAVSFASAPVQSLSAALRALMPQATPQAIEDSIQRASPLLRSKDDRLSLLHSSLREHLDRGHSDMIKYHDAWASAWSSQVKRVGDMDPFIARWGPRHALRSGNVFQPSLLRTACDGHETQSGILSPVGHQAVSRDIASLCVLAGCPDLALTQLVAAEESAYSCVGASALTHLENVLDSVDLDDYLPQYEPERMLHAVASAVLDPVANGLGLKRILYSRSALSNPYVSVAIRAAVLDGVVKCRELSDHHRLLWSMPEVSIVECLAHYFSHDQAGFMEAVLVLLDRTGHSREHEWIGVLETVDRSHPCLLHLLLAYEIKRTNSAVLRILVTAIVKTRPVDDEAVRLVGRALSRLGYWDSDASLTELVAEWMQRGRIEWTWRDGANSWVFACLWERHCRTEIDRKHSDASEWLLKVRQQLCRPDRPLDKAVQRSALRLLVSFVQKQPKVSVTGSSLLRKLIYYATWRQRRIDPEYLATLIDYADRAHCPRLKARLMRLRGRSRSSSRIGMAPHTECQATMTAKLLLGTDGPEQLAAMDRCFDILRDQGRQEALRHCRQLRAHQELGLSQAPRTVTESRNHRISCVLAAGRNATARIELWNELCPPLIADVLEKHRLSVQALNPVASAATNNLESDLYRVRLLGSHVDLMSIARSLLCDSPDRLGILGNRWCSWEILHEGRKTLKRLAGLDGTRPSMMESRQTAWVRKVTIETLIAATHDASPQERDEFCSEIVWLERDNHLIQLQDQLTGDVDWKSISRHLKASWSDLYAAIPGAAIASCVLQQEYDDPVTLANLVETQMRSDQDWLEPADQLFCWWAVYESLFNQSIERLEWDSAGHALGAMLADSTCPKCLEHLSVSFQQPSQQVWSSVRKEVLEESLFSWIRALRADSPGRSAIVRVAAAARAACVAPTGDNEWLYRLLVPIAGSGLQEAECLEFWVEMMDRRSPVWSQLDCLGPLLWIAAPERAEALLSELSVTLPGEGI